MNSFLTLKHWQLFVLLFVFPFVLLIVALSAMLSPGLPVWIFSIAPIVVIIFWILVLCWFYVLGTNLHRKLPYGVSMSLILFKLCLVIPVVYVFSISVFLVSFFDEIPSGVAPNPELFVWIYPLHLFVMCCILYTFYFNAKAIKSVESQGPVAFSDFAGDFFLFWFFPIGIWTIQPRINKLFDHENEL